MTTGGTVEAGIALGSNLGDRARQFHLALERIGAVPACVLEAVSSWYETEPEDVAPEHAGLAFLNAVAIVRTNLSAPALLRALQAIERGLGRVPGPRHAPRPIDLDLLYHGATRCETPGLVLPHPRLALRRFVLQPLADVRPDLVLPGQCLPVRDLLSACSSRGKVVLWPHARTQVDRGRDPGA